MPVRTAAILFSLALCVTTSCAFKQKRVIHELKTPTPVNCATADGDLRMLRSEKAHVVQMIAEGATAIYPAGLVLGIITGTEGTKIKVATDDYNKLIDARIAQIEQTCDVQ